MLLPAALRQPALSLRSAVAGSGVTFRWNVWLSFPRRVFLTEAFFRQRRHLSVPEAATDGEKPRVRRWMSRLVFALAGGFWLIGTGLRWTARDEFQPLAMVFYALPAPVLLVLGLIATRCAFRLELKRLRPVLSGLLMLQTGLWLVSSYGIRSQPEPPGDSLRIVFWNVCRGYLDYERIAEDLTAQNADLIAMVEAGPEGEKPELWQKLCPGYAVERLGSDMMVLVRDGRMETFDHGQRGDMMRYRICHLTIRGQPLKLIIADIKSTPWRWRGGSFQTLSELVDQHSNAPVILCGDFNTPPDSCHVDQLRTRLRNSHEVAGEGLRETWPIVLPVLTLDQVWANDRIEWLRSRTLWSLSSDHRAVVAEFRISN